jgi:iron complex transport system substrate-binding protein
MQSLPRCPGRSSVVLAVAAAVVAIGALSACSSAASSSSSSSTTGCVSSYRRGVDYFPDKVTVSDAKNFSVSYHGNYKVVTVAEPFPGGRPQSYVLVQCGTPPPPLLGVLAGDPVVQIPVRRVDDESISHLPDLDVLNSVSTIVGVASKANVHSASVKARIATGAVIEFEPGSSAINTEAVVASRPDVFLTQGTDNPGYQVLRNAGIKVIADGDYLEQTPLGRAEWIKFVSLFLNKEALASSEYATIAAGYRSLAGRAAGVTTRPTVLEGDQYKGTWYAAGGRSYMAALIRDAGGAYVFAGDTSTGSPSLDWETILQKGSSAQFWIDANMAGSWKSLRDARAADPRYAQLASFGNDNVWDQNKNSANGVPDFFEGGVVRPDAVLADLMAIFHPELEPSHQFSYYEHIPAG